MEDGETFTIPGVYPVIRVGDTFTMEVPVYRPWWALWRPRFQQKLKTFRVIASVTGGGNDD